MFAFGKVAIDPREIFFSSSLSLAFVNIKPLVPGHVLVVPKRSVERFSSLEIKEVHDLFESVQKVSRVIEKVYSATSMTIAIQVRLFLIKYLDGLDAGQTVSHVHVHIVPRVKGDWPNNDKIYDDLKNKGLDDEHRVARTIDEMELEAILLKKHFE
ncbi:bis-triphosphatase [Rozella allomycis CSF55]|uniref:Bis-triphosphatase n=1 Tax=Rozella allomycis (strain CSF55) TaxID=988480 RepID=A0A075AYL3_ROZAC|nr:Histidine triad (HIT) protein domain-containing protein [Rozella allomycis CSF55]RKP20652.1 bis-triphosphatase [Rozella allomycis CSF55]|eukprot:EPZ33807.1 Histidine triad (HIT) protein domain-containing protein [Rozella allomycis CSF55]